MKDLRNPRPRGHCSVCNHIFSTSSNGIHKHHKPNSFEGCAGTHKPPVSAGDTEATKLREMALELSSEIYGDKLNFGEVYTRDFVAWYNHRMQTNPDMGAGIDLGEFDLESAKRFFEEWVKEEIQRAKLNEESRIL